jgi:hypothetical protein
MTKSTDSFLVFYLFIGFLAVTRFSGKSQPTRQWHLALLHCFVRSCSKPNKPARPWKDDNQLVVPIPRLQTPWKTLYCSASVVRSRDSFQYLTTRQDSIGFMCQADWLQNASRDFWACGFDTYLAYNSFHDFSRTEEAWSRGRNTFPRERVQFRGLGAVSREDQSWEEVDLSLSLSM